MTKLRLLTRVVFWLALSSPAMGFDPTSPFGVTAFIPSPTRWQAMQDAMIVWNRCDFSWRMVETSQNVFDWSQTDQMVNEANARGLQIYAGLGYTPAWASSGGQPQSPPTNPADWADYVTQVVNRYKTSIHKWELWNEPNLSQFWGGTRQQYIDNILKVGADAAHAADPTCKVLAPEISRCCSGNTWMTDALNQAGNKIDIISYHQYDYLLPQDRLSAATLSIDQMHNLIVSLGYGSKPIWVTESGWRSDEPGVDEQIQGQYLVEMLKGMETRPWFQNFMWYQIWEGPTDLFGLLRQDESRKPAWYAYRDYIFASNWGPQTPFGGTARPVPGMIQAEDFDDGGAGVGYGDSDAGNNGGAYRSTNVDIEGTGDTGGGHNVGWTAGGEFLKYTINVASAGTYSIQLRVAAPSSPAGTYHIQARGINKTGVLSMPVTGGWQTYQTTTVSNVSLDAGTQVLKLYIDSGGFNLNWINVTTGGSPPGQASNPNPANGATGVNRNADLSWTAGSGATSHDVLFGTTNPPPFVVNQTGTTFDPGTMAQGTTHYWRIDEKNSNGTTTGTVWSFTTQAADTTPPGPVTNFVATPGDTQVSLSWTNPTDADFAGTMIRFSTAGYPGSPTGGTLLYDSTGTSTTHTGLTNGVTYYYTAFAHDAVPNYSSPVTANAVPADTTPPGPVTSFTATAGDTQNSLSWVNPGGDFAGTMIRFSTAGYPGSPTGGTLLYNSTGTSTTHTGLTNGVTYYYSAFAYDEVPNYSGAALASATPAAAGFCFQDEFNYPDGALVGQGGWTGNALASHIDVVGSFVRVYGGSQAKNATKSINCGSAPTGFIWVRLLAYRGTGDLTMWNVWINDSGGKNLARWYGSGTTARGRIGNTSTVTAVRTLQGNSLWDSLVVKIDPAANTTRFYFNGEDLGVYSHGSQPGDAVGQIKIERENNGSAAGNFIYLDNVRVSPN